MKFLGIKVVLFTVISVLALGCKTLSEDENTNLKSSSDKVVQVTDAKHKDMLQKQAAVFRDFIKKADSIISKNGRSTELLQNVSSLTSLFESVLEDISKDQITCRTIHNSLATLETTIDTEESKALGFGSIEFARLKYIFKNIVYFLKCELPVAKKPERPRYHDAMKFVYDAGKLKEASKDFEKAYAVNHTGTGLPIGSLRSALVSLKMNALRASLKLDKALTMATTNDLNNLVKEACSHLKKNFGKYVTVELTRDFKYDRKAHYLKGRKAADEVQREICK